LDCGDQRLPPAGLRPAHTRPHRPQGAVGRRAPGRPARAAAELPEPGQAHGRV